MLYVKSSTGRYRAARQSEVLEVASTYRAERYRGTVVESPSKCAAFVRAQIADLPHEMFSILFLDTKHRVIEWRNMFRGTIDAAAVYPREIVKAALETNAAAVILAHNHPSGDHVPSQADLNITRRLKDALALVDVRVLDHLVIGAEIYSFAEHGDL